MADRTFRAIRVRSGLGLSFSLLLHTLRRSSRYISNNPSTHFSYFSQHATPLGWYYRHWKLDEWYIDSSIPTNPPHHSRSSFSKRERTFRVYSIANNLSTVITCNESGSLKISRRYFLNEESIDTWLSVQQCKILLNQCEKREIKKGKKKKKESK